MVDIPDFLPSVNGLRFVNSWPNEADIVVKVPGIGKVVIGSASKGLCGGMVFTVLDVYWAGGPPLLNPQPHSGDPLFGHVVKRLFDSWNLPWGAMKYYQWMTLRDEDVGTRFARLRGLGWRTVVDEWPAIRSDLDAGRPSPLGLVTVKSPNPAQLGRNHQVLAYGYDLLGDQLTIKVYDPNVELDTGDGIRISLRLDRPGDGIAIAHNVGIRDQIRGFFRVSYSPAAVPIGVRPR
ncbi:MAG: hypothetical protein QOG44_3849 [Acidimicrobiaceae bacterium]|jgi:hypothetical protein|nr:hypothetical protein [Acidimicrobiaceae bacterium]